MFFFARGDDDSGPSVESYGIPINGTLRIGERTELSVCVDGIDDVGVGERERQLVQETIAYGIAYARELPEDLPPPRTRLGCPPSVVLGDVDLTEGEDILHSHLLVPGDEQSPFAMHVYFVTGGQLAEAAEAVNFRTYGYTVNSEETLCPERTDVCSGVTLGLYVDASVRDDTVAFAVLRTLGLSLGTSYPAFDLVGCIQGTSVPLCNNYKHCTTPEIPDPPCDDPNLREALGLEPTP